MDLVPHTGEITLFLVVAFMIFGLGRLPTISRALARRILGAPASDEPSATRKTE